MSVVIASCLYPAARPFLTDWCAGVLAVARRTRHVRLLIVNDGLPEAECIASQLRAAVPVSVVEPAPEQSVSSVRQTMITAAADADAESVVFCDADDVLLPTAVEQHRAVLQTADVAVGDLVVFGEGIVEEGLFFGDALPGLIVGADMIDVNYCGFSNSAIRRAPLSAISDRTFPDVEAVDWWMFRTLADAGCSIRSRPGAVARYRQHGANTLGALQVKTLDHARRKLGIVARQHRAGGGPDAAAKASAADSLAMDPRLAAIVSAARVRGGPWFADTREWLAAAAPPIETDGHLE